MPCSILSAELSLVAMPVPMQICYLDDIDIRDQFNRIRNMVLALSVESPFVEDQYSGNQ